MAVRGGALLWSVFGVLVGGCGNFSHCVTAFRGLAVCFFNGQLEQSILDFAEGLRVYGIHPNETVALIADNSHRWLIADQGKPTHPNPSVPVIFQ